MDLPLINNYEDLLISDTPLLDVRAPIEFEQGAFPFAYNLPLMSNEEREAIGIRYKNSGQHAAIELGKTLISGKVKDRRVQAWSEFTRQHPNGALYCFRGGLRSKVCQQWIFEATGTYYPRIEGGYKALRRFLLNELETASQFFKPVILGGRTGVGKTLLLNRLHQKIDLEGIFHHRGSAFGIHAKLQPRQIDIENLLAVHFLKLRKKQIGSLLLEDEAPNIGSRRIPESIVSLIQSSPLIILESSLDERVNNVTEEYVEDSLQEYQRELGIDKGFDTWSENLRKSLNKIHRRLGGDRFQFCKNVMDNAINLYRDKQDTGLFRDLVSFLLKEYYDPMYDYQLAKKQHRVIQKGNKDDVLAFLATKKNIC